MKTVLTYLAWIGGLGMLAVLCLSAVQKKQVQRVESLDIRVHSLAEGEEMLNAGDVYELLKKELGYPLENLPIEELELERVEGLTQSHPYIRSADAYLDARQVMHIEVIQKSPSLRVIPGEGTSYYLDSEGEPIPLSDAFTVRVPVATGALPGMDSTQWTKQDKERMQQIFRINKRLRSDDYYIAWIDQLIAHPNGTYSMYSAMTDQYIDLGRAERLEEQLENVKIFCENVIPVKGWKKYARINARYEQQIVGERRH